MTQAERTMKIEPATAATTIDEAKPVEAKPKAPKPRVKGPKPERTESQGAESEAAARPTKREKKVLKQEDIDTLAGPAEGQRDIIYWDKKLAGFGLRVSKGGSRQYLVRRRVKGLNRQREVVLGRPSKALTLENARLDGAQALLDMSRGKDPAAEAIKSDKLLKALTVTCSEMLEKLKVTNQAHGKGLRRPPTLKMYDRLLTKCMPDIEHAPIAEITVEKCVEIFERETAGRDGGPPVSINRTSAWGCCRSCATSLATPTSMGTEGR